MAEHSKQLGWPDEGKWIHCSILSKLATTERYNTHRVFPMAGVHDQVGLMVVTCVMTMLFGIMIFVKSKLTVNDWSRERLGSAEAETPKIGSTS